MNTFLAKMAVVLTVGFLFGAVMGFIFPPAVAFPICLIGGFLIGLGGMHLLNKLIP